MCIILKPIVHRPRIEDIIDSLKLNGIECSFIPHNSFKLEHSLNAVQFDQLIKAIVKHHNLKPQHKDWFPGTCTGDSSDFGYYVCPVIHDQYEEDDFDMCIMPDAVYFC